MLLLLLFWIRADFHINISLAFVIYTFCLPLYCLVSDTTAFFLMWIYSRHLAVRLTLDHSGLMYFTNTIQHLLNIGRKTQKPNTLMANYAKFYSYRMRLRYAGFVRYFIFIGHNIAVHIRILMKNHTNHRTAEATHKKVHLVVANLTRICIGNNA